MKKPSVLFVSNTSRHVRPYYDPSTRYRCFNLAQELSRRGHRVSCVAQAFFQKNINDIPQYDYYAFHRPSMSPLIVDFLSENFHSGKIIADFDDLNFRVQYAKDTPAVLCRGEEIAKVRKSLANIAGAASCFTRFSSSTTPLALHIREQFEAEVNAVVSNAVDPGFAGISKMVYKSNKNKKRPYRLAYFPGTASHNPDLAMIENVLAYFLSKNKKSFMLLVGPIALPEKLKPYASQIHRAEYVSFHDLPKLMASAEIVLAPLENNEFNTCKSGLKFFEAALVGCTVAATPIPDIDRFSSPLLRKCSTDSEWLEALSSPLSISFSSSEVAIDEVYSQVNIAKQADNWLKSFLE